MAMLEHVDRGTRWPLVDRLLIGRSRACDLRLDASEVSGEHASIRWESGAWSLRDLGSRNGSWVGERRLEPGKAVRLAPGDRLRFAPSECWCLVDAGPPEPAAVGEEAVVTGTGGILGLPDADAPLLTVYRDGTGQWRSDGREGLREVEHGDAIVLDGRRFILHLPSGLPSTAGEVATTLALARLRLVVSRDQEHIEASLAFPTSTLELGARSHHEVLLQLARLRLRDEEDGVAPGEHGWVYLDALAEQLGHEPPYVNVLIFRARKQLAKLGLPDAATIVERRAGTRQLRMGVAELEIVDA